MSNKHKMPVGTYFIGDPCYAISDDEWDEYLDALWKGEPYFEFKGMKCFASGTAYGDGSYQDQDAHSYPVDAGMIGCTPIEICRNIEEFKTLGHIKTFEEEFTCTECEMSREGLITIGDIRIRTDEEEEECENCGYTLDECACCEDCFEYPCVCEDEDE